MRLFIYTFALILSLTVGGDAWAARGTNALSRVNTTQPTDSISMVDTGYLTFDASRDGEIHYEDSFTTNAKCPPQYNPYFVFIPNITTWNTGGNESFIVIYKSMQENDINYTVRVHKQYGERAAGIAFTWVMYCIPRNVGNTNVS